MVHGCSTRHHVCRRQATCRPPHTPACMCAVLFMQDAKPFLHGLFNETTWDPAGLITIAGFFALTLMYLLWHQLKRLFESK